MVKQGRTMRQATEAGNYYQIRYKGKGHWYAPPAAESPEEVLACAKRMCRDIRPGMIFEVQRIIDCSIGCQVVEDAGTITA